jgi:hypothetical protein
MGGSRTRAHRARDGGQPQGGDPAVRELARQLRAALMPRPRSGLRDDRSPRRSPQVDRAPREEWLCGCGTTNWDDRRRCRECRAPVRAAAALCQPNSTAPRSWPSPPADAFPPLPPRVPAPPPHTLRPKQQVAALQSALAAARAAGAPEDVIEGLRDAVLDAGRAAADSRPLGARLDSARAKAARAATRCEAAAMAAQAAADAHLAALDEKRKVDDWLAALEAEVADCAKTPPGPVSLADGVRELLAALESSFAACAPPGGPPERILASMKGLHDILGTCNLQSDSGGSAAGAGPPCDADADFSDDGGETGAEERCAAAPRRAALIELGAAEVSDEMSDADIAQLVRAARMRRRTAQA